MSDAPDSPNSEPPRRGVRRPLWLALRLLGWVGLVLLALVVAVVCFALFPPSDLLRRAALPIAQGALNHDNLFIGALKLRPLSHIEIRDLWLGPPKGYRLPLFTVDRIVIRHDLSRILSGEVRVVQVQVDRPLARVEHKDGKLNWLAFLDNLPKSEKEPEPEEPPGEPLDLKIFIDRVAVMGLGAQVDDGQQRIALDGVNIGLWGVVRSANNADVHATVQLAPRVLGRPSVSFYRPASGGAKALGAALLAELALDAQVVQRPSPRDNLLRPNIQGRVDLRLDVTSKELAAPWDLKPVKLSTLVKVQADTLKDRAELKQLSLAFNDTELLRLHGTVGKLFEDQRLDLLLAKLHLPLDKLAPYARAVVAGIDFGGDVRVKDLRVTGAAKQLAAGKGLPGLDGALSVEKVWAEAGPPAAPGVKARLDDLNVKLAFTNRRGGHALARSHQAIQSSLPDLRLEPTVAGLSGEAQQPRPSVLLQGKITVGSVKATLGQGHARRDVRLQNLDLRLASGATLGAATKPQAFGVRLALRLPTIRLRDPKLGPIQLGLRTSLVAGGDLLKEELVLEQLALDLPGLLGLRVSARAEALGKRGFSADVNLLPIKLANVIRRLPPNVRKNLKGVKLSGAVGLRVKVKGKRPDPIPKSPFALPVQLDTWITLIWLGLGAAARVIFFSGLSGEVHAHGRPADLKVDTRLTLAAARLAGQKTVILGVSATDTVHLTRERIRAHASIGVKSFGKSDQGLTGRGLSVSLDVDTALSLPRMIAGAPPVPSSATVKARNSLTSLTLAQPGNKLTVSGVKNGLDLSYRANTAKVSHHTRVAALSQQGNQIRGLDVNSNVSLGVLPLRQLITRGSGELDKIAGWLELKLASAKVKPNALSAGPLATRLDYTYQRGRPKPVHVRHRLTLGRVKQGKNTISGLTLDHRSEVDGVRLLLPKVTVDPSAAHAWLKLGVADLRGEGLRPLRKTTAEVDATLTNKLNDLRLTKVRLRMPSNGLYVNLSGQARDLRKPRGPGAVSLPPFDVKLSAGVKNPVTHARKRATFLAPGVYAAGKAGVILRARSPDGRKLDARGRFVAHNFNLWQRSKSTDPREPEGYIRTERYLTIKDLSADLPISQRLTLALRGHQPWALRKPKASIFAEQAASMLYRALRPYSGRTSKLVIGGLEIDERLAALNRDGHLISTARRRNKVDKVSLDLAVGDSTLLLNRLYLKLFDGDIAGSVHAQLVDLKTGDVRLRTKVQLTGINLAFLDPEATERTDKTVVSGLVDVKYELCKQHIEGRVVITRLSLDMLDSLLAFLDPNKVNTSVQNNRKMLKSWYIKLANPKVKRISIWIMHSNANVDIEMETGIPGVNALIQSTLKRNRIRRLNIKPKLPKCRAPASKPKEIEQP